MTQVGPRGRIGHVVKRYNRLLVQGVLCGLEGCICIWDRLSISSTAVMSLFIAVGYEPSR